MALPSIAHSATPDDAQSHLLSAIRLYKELDYEGALAQLQLAKEMPRSNEQSLALLLYEGIILADLNQLEASTLAFKTALSLNTDVRLPVRVSPKVEARFESLREQTKRELAAYAAAASVRASPSENPDTLVEAKGTSIDVVRQDRLRSHSLIPAMIGGGLVVAGGISWAASRGELHRLRTASPSFTSEEDVQRSVSRGSTLQTLGISLVGAGTAGLITAAGMYMLGKPTEQLSLSVGTDGSSAFVYGRWP